MSKITNFSHVMMLHFYFGCFLSWFAVMLEKVRSNIHAIVKAHIKLHVIYFLRNSVWTKNNKDTCME